MIVTKPWGTTECLIKTPSFELHSIVVLPGGFCSEHKHHGKVNAFYVKAGILEVRVWSTGRAAHIKRVMLPGDRFTVDPGYVHQFFSATGAEVLEMYYPVLCGEDIERFTEGGIQSPVNI